MLQGFLRLDFFMDVAEAHRLRLFWGSGHRKAAPGGEEAAECRMLGANDEIAAGSVARCLSWSWSSSSVPHEAR